MVKKSVGCHVETTLAVIGGRWKVLILQQLLGGVRRFKELHRTLAGITHKTLTQQLREMEADGIISRKVYPQIPPKVEYALTSLGRTLRPVLNAMHTWAERHGRGMRAQKSNPDRSPPSIVPTANASPQTQDTFPRRVKTP